MKRKTNANDDFDNVWDHLADQSACDTRNGMEYKRVRHLWDTNIAERQQPATALDIEEFIRFQANLGPDGYDLKREDLFKKRRDVVTRLQHGLEGVLKRLQRSNVRGVLLVDLMDLQDDCEALDVTDPSFLDNFSKMVEKGNRLDAVIPPDEQSTTEEEEENNHG